MFKVFWNVLTVLGLIFCAIALYRWIPVIWEARWPDAVIFAGAMIILMIEAIKDLLGIENV